MGVKLPPFLLEDAPEEPSPRLGAPRGQVPGVPAPRSTREGPAATATREVRASRAPRGTHCKCLKVMSGKPVARDPEGERQSAST